MRNVQITMKIQRFGGNAPNGREQTIKVYADADNEHEALCAAFYEALDAFSATDDFLPAFGRRSRTDENFPSRNRGDSFGPHLSEAVCMTTLKPGDIATSFMARVTSPENYYCNDRFVRRPGRSGKGRPHYRACRHKKRSCRSSNAGNAKSRHFFKLRYPVRLPGFSQRPR